MSLNYSSLIFVEKTIKNKLGIYKSFKIMYNLKCVFKNL